MAEGIRFFTPSYGDLNFDVTRTISNNMSSVERMFDRDPQTSWQSVSSDDTNTITLDIEFDEQKDITNILFTEINLKEFEVQYWNGTIWVSLYSTTTNTESTLNVEFSEINSSKIRILMTKTFVVDDQKKIVDLYIMKAIGQFVGFPEPSFKRNKNSKIKKLINDRKKILYSRDSNEIVLKFKSYIGASDRALFNNLINRFDPTMVWLCGGDENAFSDYADEGFRLRDIYLCAIDKGYTTKYTENYYKAGMNLTLKFTEVG